MTARLIQKSPGRFLSLIAIVLLGTAFYIGVSSVSTVMSSSVNKYDDEHNLKDITIYSNYGFDDADVKAVNELDSVELAEGGKFVDLFTSDGGSQVMTRVHSFSDDSQINHFVLRSGRLPEAPNEVLADNGSMMVKGYPVGTVLYLTRPDNDVGDYLKMDEVTVVGTIDTPLYLNATREASTISNIYLRMFLYIPDDAFVNDYYTEMNVLIKDGKTYDEFSEAYRQYSSKIKKEIETVATDQKYDRYNEIRNDAMTQYQEGVEQYEAGLKEFDEGIAAAEKEIHSAEKQLNDGWNKVYAGRKELQNAQALLEQGKDDAVKELEEGRRKLDEGYAQLAAGKAEFAEQEEFALSMRRQLTDAQYQLNQPLLSPGFSLKNVLSYVNEPCRSNIEQLLLVSGIDPGTITVQGVLDRMDYLVNPEAIAVMNATINDIMAPRIEYVAVSQPLLDLNYETEQSPYSGFTDVLYEDGEEVPEDDVVVPIDDSYVYEESEEEVLYEAIEVYTPVSFWELSDLMSSQNETFATLAAMSDVYDLEVHAGIEMINVLADSIVAARSALYALVYQPLPDSISLSFLESFQPDLKEVRAELDLGENATLGDLRRAISDSIAQIDDALEMGREQIAAAEKELMDGEVALTEGWQVLHQRIADGQAEIDSGWDTLKKSVRQLNEGQRELDSAKAEFDTEKKAGQEKLDSAKAELDSGLEQINSMAEPEWMVLDRTQHYASETYRGTIEEMTTIASIFPVFFIAVAALVCMTTMTRLISEQRGQIGTLRALGYGGGKVSFIYLSYSAVAALIGCVLGTIIGLMVFPIIIYNTWKMLYILPEMSLEIPWKLIFLCTLVFVGMMVGVTGWVLFDDIRQVPAVIMRPKSPKLGKDILLEKIRFIWDKVTFSWKVTIRNLVRNKQRVLMTVLGVAGCSALLVTGFGINDSVSKFVDLHFTQIKKYSVSVSVSDPEYLKTAEDYFGKLESTQSMLRGTGYSSAVDVPDKLEDVAYVTIMKDEEALRTLFTVRTRVGHHEIPIEDGSVIINEKLAENYGLKKGDSIRVEGQDGSKAYVRIGGIMEYYVFHGILMTEKTYQETFGTLPVQNTLFIMNDKTKESKDEIEAATTLEGITEVNYDQPTIDNFATMIKGIRAVTIVLIVSSMGLAFVVLGNLTNVNISERMREIATLKVLGFRTNEVENYIYKENNVLVLIGALIGLPVGTFLANYIMLQVELSNIMYGRVVKPMSYVYSVILTIAFGLFVNWMMRPKLRDIQMVESLKSVE